MDMCTRSRGQAQCVVALRAALDASQREAALALRRERLTMRAIADRLGVPVSTLRRWLASHGMNRLPRLDPPPPVQRYEHAAPDDLLHLDLKELGRIVRPGHRVSGDPRDRYDRHRPHSALGYQPPMSRIPRNNVSNLNS